MTIDKIKKIVNDYTNLEDDIMEYARKRFIPTNTTNYYLTDLHFNFYKDAVAIVLMRNVFSPTDIEEKTFAITDFITYINKKQVMQNNE